MRKSQLTSIVQEVLKETIRKVGDKYVVYPEKGGKRLGTHDTRKAAEKQLAAIHINKEAVEETFPFQIKDKQFDEEDNSLISVDYTFDTPTKTYRVVLNSGEYGPEDRIFDLSFGVDKGDFNKIDTFQMTGEGSVRKIINTIVKIIEDFINKFDVNKVKASATTEKRQRVYKALFSKLPSPLSDKVEVNEIIEPADPSKVDSKIKYTKPNFEFEWEEANRYPEFKELGKEGWIEVAKKGKSVSYSSIKNYLGNVDLNFKGLEKPKRERFQSAFNKGVIEMPIAVKFSENDYDLVAGNTRLSGLVNNGVDPKIWVVNITNLSEDVHEPMNPGILKKRLCKLSCTKVRKARSKLKDKGTTYSKALQRYLNYHCN